MVPPVKNNKGGFLCHFCNKSRWGIQSDNGRLCGSCCDSCGVDRCSCAVCKTGEERKKENWNKTACRMCDGSCTCDGDIDVKDLFFSIWWIGNIIQHVVYLFCWLFIWTGDGDADWGGLRGTSASD